MMNKNTYPLLWDLEGRGGAAYTGAPCSYLLIEVRGGRLEITGRTPLRDDGDRYIQGGTEYRYVLESAEAEKLFAALSPDPRARPERILAESFEFSRPDCLLKTYLDALGLSYDYESAEGVMFYEHETIFQKQEPQQ